MGTGTQVASPTAVDRAQTQTQPRRLPRQGRTPGVNNRRVHLANVMRRVRTNPDVMRIARERPSDEPHHRNPDGGMRVDRERSDY